MWVFFSEKKAGYKKEEGNERRDLQRDGTLTSPNSSQRLQSFFSPPLLRRWRTIFSSNVDPALKGPIVRVTIIIGIWMDPSLHSFDQMMMMMMVYRTTLFCLAVEILTCFKIDGWITHHKALGTLPLDFHIHPSSQNHSIHFPFCHSYQTSSSHSSASWNKVSDELFCCM